MMSAELPAALDDKSKWGDPMLRHAFTKRLDRRQITWLRTAASTAVIALATLAAGCGTDATTAAPARTPSSRPHATVFDITTTPVLWDQSTVGAAHGHVTVDAVHADDFIVPAGKIWTISQLLFTGDLSQPNFPSFDALTIEIHSDNNASPGDLIASNTLTPTATEPTVCGGCLRTDFLYTLGAPLALTGGRYWIVLRIGAGGEFTWQTSTQHLGVNAQFSFQGSAFFDEGSDFAFVVYGIEDTPATLTGNLETTLEGLGLDHGTANSLDAKLQAILAALDRGNTQAACNGLATFINEVNAQTGNKITPAQAATLIAAANQIRTTLGC
jgi:hypothetical protein